MSLSVSNLAVEHGRVRAVWDVSFEIASGEKVGLLGANGAGKSTTMGAVIGIYPAVEGSISWEGRKLNSLPVRDRVSEGIALVPEGRWLFPQMTVQENIEMGCYPKATRGRISEGLEHVFALFPILKEKAKQPASQLSGGQQQMVAIGRALVSWPRMLLLDEPFSGVAPLIANEIIQTLEKISAQGVSILMVEQNIYRAFSFVDRAYVVENGRIAAAGTRDELLNDPEFSRKFLGLS